MKAAAVALAASVVTGLTGASLANDIVAAEQVGGASVGFVLKGSYNNATLSVSGPNGFHASTSYRGGAVAIDLTQFGFLPDGPTTTSSPPPAASSSGSRRASTTAAAASAGHLPTSPKPRAARSTSKAGVS